MILTGDVMKKLRSLEEESVQCCVTSPPYWGLRNYGVAGQLGLEPTIDLYIAHLVEVFREVRRVLKSDGTLWLNLGDSYATGAGKACSPGGGYRGAHAPDPKLAKWAGPFQQPNRMPQAGLKPKDLCMIPARAALALQADGWWLRSEIIWHKPNPMPESIRDRPTKSHETIYLLSKSARYYYDADAIKEPFQTSAKENYPGRARITGRGDQSAAAARGNDRDKSGGFPPRKGSGNITRKLADGSDSRLNTHLGRGVPYEYAEHTGRNCRSVWTIATKPFKGAHFATFPPKLIEPCILAGSRIGDVIMDCFAGACTTGLVAQQHGREFLGIELNPAYVAMGKARLLAAAPKLKVLTA